VLGVIRRFIEDKKPFRLLRELKTDLAMKGARLIWKAAVVLLMATVLALPLGVTQAQAYALEIIA